MNVATRTYLCLALCLLTALCACAKVDAQKRPPQSDVKQQRNAWVVRSLRRMESIKPGMTRADLLEVFTIEGGLSTALRRTYVYRECPYFKVDVEFNVVGRPARDTEGRATLVESGNDVIKRISKPYLAWSVMD